MAPEVHALRADLHPPLGGGGGDANLRVTSRGSWNKEAREEQTEPLLPQTGGSAKKTTDFPHKKTQESEENLGNTEAGRRPTVKQRRRVTQRPVNRSFLPAGGWKRSAAVQRSLPGNSDASATRLRELLMSGGNRDGGGDGGDAFVPSGRIRVKSSAPDESSISQRFPPQDALHKTESTSRGGSGVLLLLLYFKVSFFDLPSANKHQREQRPVKTSVRCPHQAQEKPGGNRRPSWWTNVGVVKAKTRLNRPGSGLYSRLWPHQRKCRRDKRFGDVCVPLSPPGGPVRPKKLRVIGCW